MQPTAVAKKGVKSVMALHYDGDYGDDAAAGGTLQAIRCRHPGARGHASGARRLAAGGLLRGERRGHQECNGKRKVASSLAGAAPNTRT